MAFDILYINSISQLHRVLGVEEPAHPLITVLYVEDLNFDDKPKDLRWSSDLYMVSRKDASCGMTYGRNFYDFEEGVLSFTAPNQVMGSTGNSQAREGWMLFFHPDLIRASHLGTTIDEYTFFSYEVHEALHLSKKEEGILNGIVAQIESEYRDNIDAHSGRLLVSSLELLLNYSRRFYERQFHTRHAHHNDVVSRVEQLLRSYYKEGRQLEMGMPSIKFLAGEVNLSGNYLSDLLRKETGRNAKDHIHEFVVNRAKNLLLGSQDNISEIAFQLGFNYPHYFSRMFKQKTGMTPAQYRDQPIH